MESLIREKKNFEFNAKFDGKPFKLMKRRIMLQKLCLLNICTIRHYYKKAHFLYFIYQ